MPKTNRKSIAKRTKKTIKTAKAATRGEAKTTPATDLRSYELTFVVSSKIKAEKRADVVKAIGQLVVKSLGQIDKTDEWGLRDLAYPIAREHTGWYACMAVKSPPQSLNQLDEQLRRREEIIRHLIVRTSA